MKHISWLIYLFLILGSSVYASQKNTLKNISTVAVVINISADKDEIHEFDFTDLKKEIEKKLNESRIDTVEYRNWKNNIGGSYLYINIVPSKTYSGESYAVYIDVELYQAVVLIKSRVEENKVVQGNTWSVGKLLTCKSDAMKSCLSENTIELVDLFIKDFMEVNNF